MSEEQEPKVPQTRGDRMRAASESMLATAGSWDGDNDSDRAIAAGWCQAAAMAELLADVVDSLDELREEVSRPRFRVPFC